MNRIYKNLDTTTKINIMKSSLLLYAVTDRTWLKDNNLPSQVEQAVQGGATCIQLREKQLSFDEFCKLATEVKKITDQYHIPFIINDNIDVAIAVNADGIHVGQKDMEITIARKKLGPNKIIGVSTHTVEEAILAQKNGADYLGIGAVFQTSTKQDTNLVSFDTLKIICNSVNIPVVAIGGIKKDNIVMLAGSRIDGVAVVSAIFAQSDIKKAAQEMSLLSKIVINKDMI